MGKLLALVFVPLMASTAMARECVYLRQIDSTKAVSSSELEIKTRRATYMAKVSACPMMTWSNYIIGFETFSSFNLCSGDDVLVVDRWNYNVIARCWIRDIVKK